jgi:hypothetical protein
MIDCIIPCVWLIKLLLPLKGHLWLSALLIKQLNARSKQRSATREKAEMGKGGDVHISPKGERSSQSWMFFVSTTIILSSCSFHLYIISHIGHRISRRVCSLQSSFSSWLSKTSKTSANLHDHLREIPIQRLPHVIIDIPQTTLHLDLALTCLPHGHDRGSHPLSQLVSTK